MKLPALLLPPLLLTFCGEVRASNVSGQVTDNSSGAAVGGARVTLFTPDLRFFREARSDTDGSYSFNLVALGSYRLGVAAAGYEYRETTLNVSSVVETLNFQLGPETNGGRWTIVGNTDPELLGGSGSGTLLPTGDIFFCHDSRDPVMFDPVSGLKWYPPDSNTEQGCHTTTLNTDGGMFLVGGSMGGNPLDPVVKIAKTYWRSTNAWLGNADMNVGRWYPGLVRLADERLLILGGELNNPGYGRTNGCEIYDPRFTTWTLTGSFDLPTEIPPAVLLFTGEVLKTWRSPELFNVTTETWRPTASMLQTRIGAAGGDHADHEIVHLPDGRVMAVGIAPLPTNANTRFIEFYNPSNTTWTLGPNPRAIRNRPEALILPDGRVLAFGGQYSGPTPAPVPLANAGTIPNCTKVADLYDPPSNTWRPLADLNRFIHYHNVTLLVPDGRVIATGGAGLTSNRSFAGDDSSIESFEPPYLFRGVRPRIDSLSTTDLVAGSNFTVRVSLTEAITKLVLVSARAVTHWVDGGPQRCLSLGFTQTGPLVEATVPADPVRALAGYYVLFAMVDDIPSVGRMVRIAPAPPPRTLVPGVSVTVPDGSASEPGADTGTLRITRTGSTSAPLLVQFALGGSAVNGSDYNARPDFVVIAAGTSFTNLTFTPRDDTLSEGTETVMLTLSSTAAYDAGPETNATLTLSDNEALPPPLSLSVRLAAPGQYAVDLTGSATRLHSIEISTNLVSWRPLTSLVTLTNTARLLETFPTDAPRQFFRARQGE